jgi:hypothetical protein
MTDVFPDGALQEVGTDLLVPAEALAAEPVGVRAGTTVVGVGDLAPGRGPVHRLTVATVAAPLADDQSLEQVTTSSRPVATALAILFELGPDRLEELLAHESGNRNEDLVF